jgi:6-phosphogluconolactonase/glucosamine-6-phosphate isomerase/deaminase
MNVKSIPYTINIDRLKVEVFKSRIAMGLAAANQVSEKINELLKTKNVVNIIFAAAPSLYKATYVYCIVPGEKKASAVYHTLNESISEKYPSTVLRSHPNAILFIDEKSSSLI